MLSGSKWKTFAWCKDEILHRGRIYNLWGSTSDELTAASFVSEVRHAPPPLKFVLPLYPFLHILWHCFEIAHASPVGHSSQARGASERVDPDPWLEIHAHGALVVPLARESLGLLLLLQAIQHLHDNGAEKAGDLMGLGFISLNQISEPVWKSAKKSDLLLE